jgi:predicted O-methyltransferase YrrM
MVEPHSRYDLPKFLAEQGYTYGAEIGVLRGRFSEMLFNGIPGLKLVCVDSWKNIPHHKAIGDAAKDLLSKYNTVVMHMHSMDAARHIDNESLDFVYIDANHRYHSVMDDLTEWTKKVKLGGIVCGDDYYHAPSGLMGVVEAVDEFVKIRGYELHLTDWDYKNPIKEDRQPQFWFRVDH